MIACQQYAWTLRKNDFCQPGGNRQWAIHEHRSTMQESDTLPEQALEKLRNPTKRGPIKQSQQGWPRTESRQQAAMFQAEMQRQRCSVGQRK